MIWPGEYSQEWQRHFAWFPTSVNRGTKVVWLAPYWKRYVSAPRLCIKCMQKADIIEVGHWETTAFDPEKEISCNFITSRGRSISKPTPPKKPQLKL